MHRRSWRKLRSTLIVVAAALLVLMLCYLFFLLADSSFADSSQSGDPLTFWKLRLTTATIQVLTAIWLFAFSAAVGSFINVVVWRMPRGETIVSRPSRCPYCEVNIKFRDNVPVLGWLLLKGRCRSCHLPISARYPIVEFIAGVMGLVLAFPELLSSGVNLPLSANDILVRRGYIQWTMVDVQAEFMVLYAYHGFLLFFLLTVSLIRFDGQKVPHRLSCVVLFIGIIVPVIWPHIQPVDWGQWPIGWPDIPFSDRWATSVIGFIVGSGWAWGLSALLPDLRSEETGSRKRLWALIGGVIGVYLGWQASVLTLAATMLLVMLGLVLRRRGYTGRYDLFVWLTLAYGYLLCWRSLDVSWRSTSPSVQWGTLVFIAVACFGLSQLARRAIGSVDEQTNSAAGDRSSDGA